MFPNFFVYILRESLLKIADFGLSKIGNRLRTYVGTPHYIAPEVLKNGFSDQFEKQNYTNSVDMWSLGCILFRFNHFYMRRRWLLARQDIEPV